MPIFSELRSWELDDSGNVKVQLGSPDGQMREATFNRSVITPLLVVLNRFLMDSADQFPEGVRELLLAQVPIETASVSLPGGGYALSIRGQSGTTHQFPIEGNALGILSNALTDLQAIHLAEAVALQSGTKQ